MTEPLTEPISVSYTHLDVYKRQVVLGLSGGVDSSVAVVLLNRAIGKNLTCIFVDHGMLRKNEFRNVLHDYECLGLNVIDVYKRQIQRMNLLLSWQTRFPISYWTTACST